MYICKYLYTIYIYRHGTYIFTYLIIFSFFVKRKYANYDKQTSRENKCVIEGREFKYYKQKIKIVFYNLCEFTT